MRKLAWNALRVGDTVLVHDTARADTDLAHGTVTTIDVHHAKGSVNGVGVRLDSHEQGGLILWPSHLAVHADPPEQDEPCWRCAELHAAGSPA